MSHEAYLKKSLAKYKHPDVTKLDILTMFKYYTDLRPVLDSFVFNDGTRQELLCLDGTVPVPYRGNTYNIPICVWLMDTHPHKPPIVFVRPTSTMMLKTGQHIDSTGRVHLLYLHEWKFPQADLLGLFKVLIVVFGVDPPVYAKVADPTRPAYRPKTQDGNRPYSAAGGQTSVGEDVIHASMLSAVKDTVRWHAREALSQSHAELENMRRTQDDLNQGRTTLEQMLQSMEKEQSDVERTIMMLQEKDDEIQQVIHEMETRGEVNVDEAVVPTAPLYKQLVNTFAEEQAIEDALYYLSDAQHRGVIDVEQFLKKVRELSRKQYMLRALIQKCRQKAGLPEI